MAIAAVVSMGITPTATGQQPSASTAVPGSSAPASTAPAPTVRIGAVGKSLCAALTEKEVRKAVGYRMRASDEVDHCEWHASKFGDPEVGVSLNWADLGIADLKAALTAEGSAATLTDTTVGGRPALLTTGTYPPSLLIELAQGPITIQASDPYGGDYSGALPKLGELVVQRADTLVPLPPGDPVLLAMFPSTVGDLPFRTAVLYPEKLFTKDSGRDALRKALKKAGKSITDVSMGSGSASSGNDFTSLTALRIAGAEAADFTRFGINAAGLWGDFPPVPDPVPSGSLGVVQMPSGGQMYVYPKDDVVWVVVGDDPLVDQVLAALPGAPDRSALPTPTPAPTPDLSTPTGRVQSRLPATIGGKSLDLTVLTGKEAEGYMTADGKKVLRQVVKAQGKAMQDLLIVQGSYGGDPAIQALTIEGGDGAPLAEVLLDQIRGLGLLGKKEKPKAATVGGKSVGTVPYTGNLIYLYTTGDAAWAVTSSDEAKAAEFLAALP